MRAAAERQRWTDDDGKDGMEQKEIQISTISLYLQHELRRQSLPSVTAVEAARWLDRANILRDSRHRPGLPLRDLLRQGAIVGQRQEANNRWFIDRVPLAAVEIRRENAEASGPVR